MSAKKNKIQFGANGRGFAVGEFQDRNSHKCSIQDSSIATERCLWLGIDDAQPVVLVPGKGWQPVPFPPDTLFNTRMHLTKAQAKELIISLQRFVDTGSVAPRSRKKRTTTGT